MANTATTLGNLGVTNQAMQQNIYDKQYQNQMAQYLQPYQQLQFQAGLLAGVAPSYYE
jgi:Spy/CpxP family protein refolding chaperone